MNNKDVRRMVVINPYKDLNNIDEFDCDAEIADLILLLNRKGFYTEYCCAGHDYESYRGFYIMFKYMSNDKYDILYNTLKQIDTLVIEDSYDITAYNSEGEYMNFITGDENCIKSEDFIQYLKTKGMSLDKSDIIKYFIIRIAKFDDEEFYNCEFNIEECKEYRNKVIYSLLTIFSDSKFEYIDHADQYIFIKK